MVSVNARKGHSFTMWLIVCDSRPQSHDSESRNPHLNIIWPLLPCSVLMRFSVVRIFLVSSNPGCSEAEVSITLCTSGFSDFQKLRFTSRFPFVNFIAVFQGGFLNLSLSTSSGLRMRLSSLQSLGRTMLLRTGSHLSSVDYTSPLIICIDRSSTPRARVRGKNDEK